MKLEQESQKLLGVTRAKAKMLEYGIPEEHHIKIGQDPAKLFTISIGLLGDFAARINREELAPNKELQKNMFFSAQFFDAYLQSKLNETLDPYFVLLGSASYYLCDFPGSAAVLAKHINNDCPDLEGGGLENLLFRLLQANFEPAFRWKTGLFSEYIAKISNCIFKYFTNGDDEATLINLTARLIAAVYEFGTPRQLLFSDVIGAVLRKKMQYSGWKTLPLYSGLPRDKWVDALQKKTFIKELWLAQRLIGEADVLKGKSATIQMPTSAGKSKAIEMVIRSAFLAERTNLAIIIAPYRALCHEIRNTLVSAFKEEPIKINGLSDTLQVDFEITKLLGHQQILVVTPEKFLYVLRCVSILASYVGLLILDEAHQFDSGARGITYELLLTSLRAMLQDETQKVLISAVASNAERVQKWFSGDSNVIEGINLNPTLRTVGFSSWRDPLGRVEYVDSKDIEQDEFYVPRVIEKLNLERKGSEQKPRFFPEKSPKAQGQEIALYLGLKLVKNGSIAIFCGKKATVEVIGKRMVEIVDRGILLPLPREFSNRKEVNKLYNLHVKNIGIDAIASKNASYGVFSHHGNTPHGIRLSIEYALRENLIKFIICTSTLAQGVNLPIRYLIVTSLYQGKELIKVRDFHNLIGRAGRSGMHTEGSILFADPAIYDKKQNNSRQWNMVKKLLDPGKLEDCTSSLLQFVPKMVIRNKRNEPRFLDVLYFAKTYINGSDSLESLIKQIVEKYGKNDFTVDVVKPQFEFLSMILSSIEGFLLSNWDVAGYSISEAEILNLAEQTLAYFLADDESKKCIQELFKLLGDNISKSITDPIRRQTFGKTLYGVNDAKAIEAWAQKNVDKLSSATSPDELLNLIWPLLSKHIHNKDFNNFDKIDVLNIIANGWISGASFSELFRIANANGCKLGKGARPRQVKIDHIINLCENGLAYDGALLASALCTFVEIAGQGDTSNLISALQLFQKRLKYGLSTETTIIVYELGFSDRVVAQDLVESLNIMATQEKEVIKILKEKWSMAITVIEKYPAYFLERLKEFL